MVKLRTDSWAAGLTEEQLWQLYNKSLRMNWPEIADWAVKEFGIKRKPKRTAYFEWKETMAKAEHLHRIECGALAQGMIREGAATNTLQDGEARKALEQRAVELAMLTNDIDAAKDLYNLVLAIRDRELHAAELDIKERSQKTKDAQLKLAREKFEAAERRENAAKATLGDTKLTDEERVAKIKSIFGMK